MRPLSSLYLTSPGVVLANNIFILRIGVRFTYISPSPDHHIYILDIFGLFMTCGIAKFHTQNLSGIDHVGGDMFVAVPKGEVVLLQVSEKE